MFSYLIFLNFKELSFPVSVIISVERRDDELHFADDLYEYRINLTEGYIYRNEYATGYVFGIFSISLVDFDVIW